MKMRSKARATCITCNRIAQSPYRRRDASGETFEGCVDASHTGHVHGAAADWHWRQEAIAIRRADYIFLQALNAK